MNRYKIENTYDLDNPVKLSGIAMPNSKIVASNDKYFVMKTPGHKFWVQNPPGPTHKYAPAEFVVYTKPNDDDWIYPIISFDVRETGSINPKTLLEVFTQQCEGCNLPKHDGPCADTEAAKALRGE